tara:strand:+ start:92 stop:298 length:207 start_codon:yes stop_codon:yes gene_type:complete
MFDVMDNFTNEMLMDLNSNVTRFEVIDHTWAGTGRIVNMTHYDVSVELSYQDDGKTLKVFLKDKDHAE